MRNTIISLLLCVIGVTHLVIRGADKQLITKDLRLELLKKLKQGDNPIVLIKQHNLDGLPEIFALIGPRVIQNIVLDYLHEGKKEFILEDCRSAVAKKYKEDKKLLAEFLKNRGNRNLEQHIQSLCADYFYAMYPQRLDLVVRLPLLASILWDTKKQNFMEISQVLTVDKIDHLSLVNYEKFLYFNPKSAAEQSSNKDALDTLCVGYKGHKKGSLISTYWDVQTGLLIDYRLMRYCENDSSSSFDKDFSITTSQDHKTVTAYTMEQTKVKVMLQDDAKDLNCAILATMLNQREKR